MNTKDKTEHASANLSLEPMHGGVLEIVARTPAEFHTDTRSKSDRRATADRRVDLRFEAGRRSGKDRRPKTSWEPGSNL